MSTTEWARQYEDEAAPASVRGKRNRILRQENRWWKHEDANNLFGKLKKDGKHIYFFQNGKIYSSADSSRSEGQGSSISRDTAPGWWNKYERPMQERYRPIREHPQVLRDNESNIRGQRNLVDEQDVMRDLYYLQNTVAKHDGPSGKRAVHNMATKDRVTPHTIERTAEDRRFQGLAAQNAADKFNTKWRDHVRLYTYGQRWETDPAAVTHPWEMGTSGRHRYHNYHSALPWAHMNPMGLPPEVVVIDD